MKIAYYSFLVMFLLLSCKTQDLSNKAIYKSEDLKIVKVTDHIYQHISYLDTEDWGRVGCNGMIVLDHNEALIYDTPTDDKVSAELISWIENELLATVKGIVVTHFHVDCLGGLAEFHRRKIPSFAGELTQGLATINDLIIPQNAIRNRTTHEVGDIKVISRYFGPGHTQDNIVGYVPSENTLFGGCLVKANGAGKGNLADANIKLWPSTIQKVKETYPMIKTIIPGHGETGGVELLDYTAELFSGE